MSENPIINNSNLFGLNLTLPKKSIEDITKVVRKDIEEISINPFTEYFNENDRVFSGEVSKEIMKYQAQIYSLGQAMREGKPGNIFNAKV